MWVKVKISQSCPILCNPMYLYSPWNYPGQNTEMGSLSLLQEIFPTQGSNPGLLNCGQILYQLSSQGSSRILESVACPFSRGISWPRNQPGVSCIAGKFFNNWTSKEAHFSTPSPGFIFSNSILIHFLSLIMILKSMHLLIENNVPLELLGLSYNVNDRNIWQFNIDVNYLFCFSPWGILWSSFTLEILKFWKWCI